MKKVSDVVVILAIIITVSSSACIEGNDGLWPSTKSFSSGHFYGNYTQPFNGTYNSTTYVIIKENVLQTLQSQFNATKCVVSTPNDGVYSSIGADFYIRIWTDSTRNDSHGYSIIINGFRKNGSQCSSIQAELLGGVFDDLKKTRDMKVIAEFHSIVEQLNIILNNSVEWSSSMWHFGSDAIYYFKGYPPVMI